MIITEGLQTHQGDNIPLESILQYDTQLKKFKAGKLIIDINVGNTEIGNGDNGGGNEPSPTLKQFSVTRDTVDTMVESYSNLTQWDKYGLENWYKRLNGVEFIEGDSSGTFPLVYTMKQEVTFKQIRIEDSGGAYAINTVNVFVDDVLIIDSYPVNGATNIVIDLPVNKGTVLRIEPKNGYYIKINNIKFDIEYEDKTIVEDNIFNLLNTAFVDNKTTITQDVGQTNWEKFLFETHELWSPSSGSGSFDLKTLHFSTADSGYQIIKLILLDTAGEVINYIPDGSNSMVLRKPDGTNFVTITQSGYEALMGNDAYKMTNVLDTQRLPDGSTSGWFIISSGPAEFTLDFDKVQQIGSIRAYRCGSLESFNGGTNPYKIVLSSDPKPLSGPVTGQTFDVPKLDNSVFPDQTKFTVITPNSSGTGTESNSTYTLEVSSDGLVWNTLAEDSQTAVDSGAKKLTTTTFTHIPDTSLDSLQIKLTSSSGNLDTLDKLKVTTWNT